MVCKACGHRWGSLLPPAPCPTNTERPYRPAKVVRVHGEVGDGIIPTVYLGISRRNFRGGSTYGCGDGRIEPTRCALIDGRLGDRCSQCRVCNIPPVGARSARSELA